MNADSLVTQILGPWAHPRYRAKALAGMDKNKQERTRLFKYAGKYWLEVWPIGTRMGNPAVARAPRPSYAVLPPLDVIWSPNQSSRIGRVPRGIVWHETEGSYLGAVSWLCQPRARASAHLVLREDGGAATQLVPWGEKAWHAVNANVDTIGIELAGFTSEPNNRTQLRNAARLGAYLSHAFDIPVKIGTRYGISGHATHKMLGSYGGGHSDPGGFDFERFVGMIQDEYARGGFPRSYGYTKVG